MNQDTKSIESALFDSYNDDLQYLKIKASMDVIQHLSNDSLSYIVMPRLLGTLPKQSTIKNDSIGFKINHTYFDEFCTTESYSTFTWRYDDKYFWKRRTVAEFITFGAYVDVVYGWRERIHIQKDVYSVRVDILHHLVFSPDDMKIIHDSTVWLENLLKDPDLDINLYDFLDTVCYKMSSVIYNIPRYSRGGVYRC